MRNLSFLIATIVAALLLASACGDGGQPGAPATGKIAFTSGRDGNEEIYVMNADGSGQTRLTDDPAADTFPAWSPVP